MAHLVLIRKQFSDLISEIKSRPEHQKNVITEMKKRIKGFQYAHTILSKMLAYTPYEGQSYIDTADVTNRLNECVQLIKEAELIILQVETSYHE